MKTAVKFLALCACVSLVVLAIFSLKLDFSSMYPLGSDIDRRLSMSSWIYFLVLGVAILIMYYVLDPESRWIIPFTLAGIFIVSFQLAQYPAIQNSDAFMHAGAARALAEYGNIPSMAVYSEYPGCFISAATLSQVIGLPVLETDIILSSVVNFSIMLLLLVIGDLTVGRKWRWMVPTIYLVMSFRLYTSLLHYSPQLQGLGLYLTFLVVLLKTLKSQVRQWKAILIMLLSVIIITHPFTTVFAVASLLGILVVGKIRSPWQLSRKTYLTLAPFSFFILAITMFVSWHVFVASKTLETSIEFIPSIFGKGFNLATSEDIVYSAPLGLLGSILQYYRLGIYGLSMILSALAVIWLRHKIEIKLTLGLVAGILIGAVIIFFSPAVHYALGRIIIFAGILLSILSTYVVVTMHTRLPRLKRILEMIYGMIPLLVIATFLVSNMYSSAYISFVRAEDMSVSSFVVQKVDRMIFTPVTEAMVLFYYGKNLTTKEVVRNDADPETARLKFERGGYSVQDMPRQNYYFGFGFVENMSNIIYSNGIDRVYTRMSMNPP
jgi:hypothetical protein